MAALYHYFYEAINLRSMGLLLGLLLFTTHLFALSCSPRVRAWLQKLPRNRRLGIFILAVDALWAYMVISNMDLGEFFTIRRAIQLGIPIGFVLIITFADEFLAVRATGVLFLLAASPILGSAFLEAPASRLLIPLLAYVMVLKGLFWVGMPYLMRESIEWVAQKPGRWRAAAGAGAAYGAALVACALAFY
ncbi:MAG: hypothetical protein ACC661_05470 [Verrucomicrobiales bacterium]